jgi:hypothetical protein
MTQQLVSSPLDSLHCPPFGTGFQRRVSEKTTGTTSGGIPYQGFEYSSTAYKEYAGVATLRLSICLPPFFVSLPQNPRAGIAGVQVPNQAGLLVVADSLEFGQAVLDGSLVAIRAFAQRRALDLAIDGDSLTAIQVPLGTEGLRAYCEDMALVGQSISSDPALRRFVVPPIRERGMTFFGYPGTIGVDRDDRLLANLPTTPAGDSHQALDVLVTPPGGGLQAIGFRHHYEVHGYAGDVPTMYAMDVFLVTIPLPFRFRRFGMDWRGFGRPLMLFAPAFEANHQISADLHDFGGDVARPLLNWLMAMNPPPFAIQEGSFWFTLPAAATPATVEWCRAFAVEFFDHLEDRVWHGLGYRGNPLEPDLQ